MAEPIITQSSCMAACDLEQSFVIIMTPNVCILSPE